MPRGSVTRFIRIPSAVAGLAAVGASVSVEASMAGMHVGVFPSPSAVNDFKMITLEGKRFTLSDLRERENSWKQ